MNTTIAKILGAGAAFVAFVVTIHFGYELSHDHPTSFIAGLIAGWMAWQLFDGQVKANEDQLDHPDLKFYPLNRIEVMAAVKDKLSTMTMDGNWWSARQINTDVGFLIYEMTWQDITSKGRLRQRHQVVLTAQFRQRGSGTCLEIDFTVPASLNRVLANKLIAYTTESIETELAKICADRLKDKALL